jgi:predicted AlkP superfamily pyrophosphatase or phosphodiesterase
VLAASGCGSDTPEARPTTAQPKVVLIGWDAATWHVIRPMVEAGQLPNLARLLDEGAHGVLRADPPILSPVVWTTIATGFPSAEHGITGFELPDPSTGKPILASTVHRRRAPLWSMASVAGRSAGIVGWWTTWPADEVDGFVVTDHLAYNRFDDWTDRGDRDAGASQHLTWPEELAAELRPLRLAPETVDPAPILALAPFGAAEREEMLRATKPVLFHAPSVIKFAYTTDASNHAFARHLLDTRGQPDLFAVIYVLSDVAGHVFWHHYEPQLFPDMKPVAGDPLAATIPNVYRLLDRWTGEILDRVAPDSMVVVLSDHGMGPKGVLPKPWVNPAGDHTSEGILIVSGPGVSAGVDLGVVAQVDLAPTLLARLGIPIASDMPGRILPALLPPGTLPADLDRIATYGDGRSRDVLDSLSPARQEYEDRLRSLGYIK